jgi:hypothetical protein
MTESRDVPPVAEPDADVGESQAVPPPDDPELEPDVPTDPVPVHPDDPTPSEDDGSTTEPEAQP